MDTRIVRVPVIDSDPVELGAGILFSFLDELAGEEFQLPANGVLQQAPSGVVDAGSRNVETLKHL
ncbi:hypothetical protein [Sinorhizobium arboris]|uniref:hypothetical protein n=1 Tax=Sinorhizobium arboris TaxID=76745 RepID=UPI000487AC4E|nr:hypothetical protein [Sinorhizobium arboris]